MGNKVCFFVLLSSCFSSCLSYEEPSYDPIRNVEDEEMTELPFEEYKEGDDINLGKDWKLFWNDEFSGGDKEFDARWNAENYSSAHIDCSRWRENAVISDGTLKIVYKKEYKGGKEYTTANVMTKEKFLYGYFEARYKYAPAYATNNSFWIRTDQIQDGKGSTFEIDINEGKYPNLVATNYADTQTTKSDAKAFIFGSDPLQKIMHETGKVEYRYFKLVSNQGARFHLKEFCAFPAMESYPDLTQPHNTWTKEQIDNDYVNKGRVHSCSGVYENKEHLQPDRSIDRDPGSSWCSQMDGEKWIIYDLGEPKIISCFLFLSGYGPLNDTSNWDHQLKEYKIYGSNDLENWTEVASKDITDDIDFSKEYHTFGLEWDENEFSYYVDRKKVRTIKNEWCYSPATVFVSGAVVLWAGEITDALDGATMEVDYVRIYKKKTN